MRTYRNLIAVLVVVVILALMILLSGCTIYRVHSVPGESAKVSIYSTRSFVAPELAYHRRGDDATFTFGADAVSQPGPDEYARGVIGGIEMFKKSNICLPHRTEKSLYWSPKPATEKADYTRGYIRGVEYAKNNKQCGISQ